MHIAAAKKCLRHMPEASIYKGLLLFEFNWIATFNFGQFNRFSLCNVNSYYDFGFQIDSISNG